MNRTTIVIPTPEAEPAVAELRQRHDVWARRGFASHVTVTLFLPPDRIGEEVLDRLHELAAAQPATTFSLVRVRVVPGAVLLVPEPRDPFRELRRALEREWPEVSTRSLARRISGPHLTVARTVDMRVVVRIRRELAPQLPIHVDAHEAHLVRLAPRVERVAALPFAAKPS